MKKAKTTQAVENEVMCSRDGEVIMTLWNTGNGRCQIKCIILVILVQKNIHLNCKGCKEGDKDRQRKKGDEEAVVILCLLKCHLGKGKYIRVILLRGEKNTVKKQDIGTIRT